jgi:hypothetical protein
MNDFDFDYCTSDAHLPIKKDRDFGHILRPVMLECTAGESSPLPHPIATEFV